MKHNDDYSKKLIKNFVYLVVSALVLVSATVAWFSKNDESDVDVISAEMSAEQFNVSYYEANVFGIDFIYDTESSEALQEWQELTWLPTSNIDIEALYPGAFGAFRINVQANRISTPSLVFRNVSCTGTDNVTAVYDSVFIYAAAVDASGNLIDFASGSISSFIDEEANDITMLNIGEVERNGSITVYFNIGIPGYDVNGTHAVLQETGATISIESVEISG